MIYNVPADFRNVEAETVARLAEVENIVAIKEASGDLDQVSQIRRLTHRSSAFTAAMTA